MTQQHIPKQTSGQSGEDGNPYLRTKRIYIQVTPEEQIGIKFSAKFGGFNSMAQYVRHMALTQGAIDNPVALRRHYLDCEYQLTKLGHNMNQIARLANSRKGLDEEILHQLIAIEQDATLLLFEARKKVLGQK